MNSNTTRSLIATAALLAITTSAAADEPGRIVSATVYLKGAVVERELKVPGGTRHVVMNCVPESAEIAALQVDGASDLRVGEIVAESLLGTEAAACMDGARDPRTKRLAARQAELEHRVLSNQLALDYLKRWNAPLETAPAAATTTARGTAGPAGPASRRTDPSADTDAMRRAALDLLDDQGRAQAELKEVTEALTELGNRGAGGKHTSSDWSTVRFDVATAAPATLRVRYFVDDVKWSPYYRATLDVANTSLVLDRMATVIQDSGEPWTDVALTLSTLDPSGKPQGPVPSPWTLEARHVVHRDADVVGSSVQRVEMTGGMPGPDADLAPKAGAVDQRAFETLFKTGNPATFTPATNRHELVLETMKLPVTLRARVNPRQDPRAYLIADAPRPPGIWPVGRMNLIRDGQFAGDAKWGAGDDERMLLPFGRDERIRVAVEHPTPMTADRGLFGSRVERRWADAYTITNLHATPTTVEVLDAMPVSSDDKVRITTTVRPEPTVRDWKAKPGVASWTFTLAPKASQRIDVSHVVEWPSDLVVPGLGAY